MYRLNPLFAALFALMLIGCSQAQPATKPVVSVLSPPNGTRAMVGETITLYVAAASDVGIKRIELRNNGQVIASQVNNEVAHTFSPRISFTATQVGTALLSVVAFDTLNAQSDAATVQILIEGRPLRPNPEPTATKPATSTPALFNPNCALNAAFVADVNIPDNTVIAAGSTFIKTWRVRNTSACDWGDGFELVFVQGSKMGAVPNVSILATPRNGQLDLTMSFIAPKEPDTYSSTWQLRAPNGKLFGTQMYVKIKVL